MKRCAPLLARVQRVPQRLPRAVAPLVGSRRALATGTSNFHLQNPRRSTSTPRPHRPLVRFHATSSKTPVAPDAFASLKEFLMQPSATGAAADAARVTLQRMMEHHVYADMAGQEAAVMSMVADALEDPALVIAVYACLRAARVAPSPMTLELTAAACAVTGDVATVHTVVDDMHRAVDLMHPSLNIYENAVRACHVARQWMPAKQLLEAMANDRLDASREIQQLVIETCVESRELTATTRLVDACLPTLDHDERVEMLEALLTKALALRVLDHALYFCDALAQRHVAVPPETYEALLSLSTCSGKWHDARVLLAQLTNAKALPVAAPSHAFTRDTQALLSDMHKHKIAISQDVYNAALRAYGATTQRDKAAALLETMAARGVTPDVVSYAAVICSCGSDVAASQRYFDAIQDKGLALSMDACHAFVLVPSRAKQWDTVLERFATLKTLLSGDERRQMERDARIMACVATAHGQLEHDDAMLRVFTSMKVNGLVPNLYVYAEAMRAYIRKGQWRHALMLFDHLWTEGIDKDKLATFPLPWDAAVDAAIAGDDTERLETLYQQITTQHGRVRPHTAATLIDAMTNLPTDKIWHDFRHLAYLHARRNADNQLSWHVVNAVLKRAVSEWDAPLAERVVAEAEHELGMRRFNAMTYSLLLELYARTKDHDSFMQWLRAMADADSKVTAYTTRALVGHLRTLAELDDRAAVREVAAGAARVFSVDRDRRVPVKFTPFTDVADLGRKILDLWEVRGHDLHIPTLAEYIGLCRSSMDLEDVFQRLDRYADRDEPLAITPEFVHAFFLTVAETAPELQPRLRDFLIDCLETQPKESARAALQVFCSCSPTDEVVELFEALVSESEEEIEDDELVMFFASCIGDSETSLDVASLHTICSLVATHDVALGAGSITFLLRTALTLARVNDSSSYATEELIKQLLSSALEGSSRDELRAFIQEIATDPEDASHIDALLDVIV